MNPKRPFFSHPSGTIMIVLLCMASCLLVAGACAADVYVTGYLGDIIDMHGSSYRGTQVYLFMTGPGLPTDGVTLTDVTQRADQGQFTIVELDSSQQWWFNWDTSRIWNEINPGTYTVYVSTEPVDYSHLGGSDTYKTLSVYLQDPGNRKGGSSSSSYTLHLDAQVTTPPTVQSVEIPAPAIPSTPAQQPTVPVPPVVTTQASAITTPTKAAMQPMTPIIAVIGGAGLLLYPATRRR